MFEVADDLEACALRDHIAERMWQDYQEILAIRQADETQQISELGGQNLYIVHATSSQFQYIVTNQATMTYGQEI